MMLVV